MDYICSCFGVFRYKQSDEHNSIVDECPICLDNKELILLKKCKHAFCINCIQNWFIKSGVKYPSCPICRKQIKWTKSRFRNYLSIEVY